MSPVLLLALLLGLGGALLLLLAGMAAYRGSRRPLGRVRYVDLPARRSPPLRSERWRLTGRPDEIRERSDGTMVPVEVKSRAAPRGGPPRSHIAQVAAYCLLIEEVTGRRPPFGILRYSDGREFRVPWEDRTRRWLSSIRRELDRPYDGRANPSPGRCGRCAYREGCEQRAR